MWYLPEGAFPSRSVLHMEGEDDKVHANWDLATRALKNLPRNVLQGP